MIQKTFLAIPASILTAAVLANRPDTLPQDPEIKDPTLQGENLLAWEIYRIFYHALARTLDSPDWPAPTFGKDWLQSLLSASSSLAPLLQQVLRAIPTLTPTELK